MLKAQAKRVDGRGENTGMLSQENAKRYEESDIARVAYALWEARGSNGGSAEEDWYRAEEQLRAGQTRAGQSGTALANKDVTV